MIGLISAEKARDSTIRNSPTLSIEKALSWIDSLIRGACLAGKCEVSMDIQTWHVVTYGQGYEVKNVLKGKGYGFNEQEYINIVDGIERKEKKVIISW